MKEEHQLADNGNGETTTKLATTTIAGTESGDSGATVTSGGQQDIRPGTDLPGGFSSTGFPGALLAE